MLISSLLTEQTIKMYVFVFLFNLLKTLHFIQMRAYFDAFKVKSQLLLQWSALYHRITE